VLSTIKEGGSVKAFGKEIGRLHDVAKPLGFQGSGNPIYVQNLPWP